MVVAISPWSRIAYQDSGALPGADFNAIVDYAIAERGGGGSGNRTLPYPLPQNVSPCQATSTSCEGPHAFNADLTEAVWLNVMTKTST